MSRKRGRKVDPKNARALYIEVLENMAKDRDRPRDMRLAKAKLKYVKRVPDSSVLLEMHRLFMSECQFKSTAHMEQLRFWIDLLEGDMVEFLVEGDSPDPDDLVESKMSLHTSWTTSVQTTRFVDSLQSVAGYKMRELLFRADLKEGKSAQTISDKVSRVGDNLSTVAALFVGQKKGRRFVAIYYPKTISEEEAFIFLRYRFDWWLRTGS